MRDRKQERRRDEHHIGEGHAGPAVVVEGGPKREERRGDGEVVRLAQVADKRAIVILGLQPILAEGRRRDAPSDLLAVVRETEMAVAVSDHNGHSPRRQGRQERGERQASSEATALAAFFPCSERWSAGMYTTTKVKSPSELFVRTAPRRPRHWTVGAHTWRTL